MHGIIIAIIGADFNDEKVITLFLHNTGKNNKL